jgi:hypothetical protein
VVMPVSHAHMMSWCIWDAPWKQSGARFLNIDVGSRMGYSCAVHVQLQRHATAALPVASCSNGIDTAATWHASTSGLQSIELGSCMVCAQRWAENRGALRSVSRGRCIQLASAAVMRMPSKIPSIAQSGLLF